MLAYSHTVGILSLTGQGLSNPLDVTVTDDGELYVLNRSNFHQESISVRISVWTQDGRWKAHFGHYGGEDHQLVWPTAIATDGVCSVYVTDEHKHCVQRYTLAGEFIGRWGSRGRVPGAFLRPSGIAVDPAGSVLVSDQLNHRVQKFSADWEYRCTVGDGPGAGEGQLSMPWGVATDREGCIYVADWGNDRIQLYDPEGRFMRTLSSRNGPEQLHRPADVAVDDRYVFVADWGNDRIQVLDREGEVVSVLRGDADLSARASEWLALTPEARSRRETADRVLEGRFWGPTGVERDRGNRLYIADSCRHRIQVYAIHD